MLKIRNIFILFVFAFVVNSCKKENLYDCFKPTGTIETRVIEVSDFQHVVVFDKIDLYLTQGPNFEVKLEAGKNLFMNIKTTVSNGTLTIDNINKCNFVRSPKKKIVAYIKRNLQHVYSNCHKNRYAQPLLTSLSSLHYVGAHY